MTEEKFKIFQRSNCAKEQKRRALKYKWFLACDGLTYDISTFQLCKSDMHSVANIL